MTISASTKLRAVGGASIIAMATGLGSIANAAPPSPVAAVPTPVIPAAPANPEECALVVNPLPPQVICAPGTDPDGFDEDYNSIDLIVEAGSQVQGEINLLAGVNATINGDIVVNSGSDSALELTETATVVNNGFIGGDAAFNGFIITGTNSTITNNGTIFNDGSSNGVGVNTGVGSTFTNNGLIAMQGFNVFGVIGQNAIVSGNNVTVVNSETGSIIVDGQGGLSAAIRLGDDATVTNDGLLQTFGAGAEGVLTFARGNITNNGNIQTAGDGAEGISTGEDSTVTNSETGNVFTFGNSLAAVLVGTNSTVDNSGVILTQGDSAIGVVAGDGSTVTNGATGKITTLGTNAGGVIITGDGTLLNNGGLIQTTGTDAVGVTITGAATITNSGTIRSGHARAIDVADVSTIDNLAGGVISGAGGDAIRFNTAGSTLTNAGAIGASGAGALGVNAQVADMTVTNSGSINTSGTNSAAIFVGGTGTVTNSGTVTTTADSAVAVAAGAGSTITNEAGGSISTIGVNSGAVVFTSDGVLVNDGTIDTLRADATAVTALGTAAITNNGTINATTGRAVDIQGGSVTNAAGATISGGTDAIRSTAAGLVVFNSGAITAGASGILGGASSDYVANLGTISGGTNAAALGAGADVFVSVNDGSETGNVDGGADDDVFAKLITDGTDRTFNLDLIGTQYLNFEDFRFGTQSYDYFNSTDVGVTPATGVMTLTGSVTAPFVGIVNTAILDGTINGTTQLLVGFPGAVSQVFNITGNGAINATGDAILANQNGWTINNAGSITAGDDGIDGGDDLTINNTGTISADDRAIDVGDSLVLTNSGTITSVDRAVNAGANVTITNEAGGLITTTGDNDTIQTDENLTIVNNGTISNSGFDTKIIDAGDNLTVTNNGLITSDWKGIEGEDNFTLTNNAGARIFSAFDETVEADGPGLVVVNDGEIVAPKDDAIDGGDNVTITNTGLIQGGENDGLELNSGTITNSGTIISISSDPNGTLTLDTMLPELDAGIDFDAGTPGNEDGVVTNFAGGLIEGDIGIETSPGNVDNPTPNAGSQQVVNFGTITGRLGDAVRLGEGADEFQQWTGAVVNGNILLGAASDLFVLEGSSSSVTGTISGGTGDDTAILAGILDSDNFADFETYQLGSTLGGTLNDVTVTGNRTLDGDVRVVGTANFNLGVDSIENDGDLTLEAGSVINIATPLDQALVGQTVVVIRETGTFTDNGGTINIIDDDLLIDYTPVIGSILVQVNAVNPLIGNPDPNLAAFSGAVGNALNNGTLSAANFAALNALNASQFQTAAQDALPGISDGLGREIFETASFASQSLDRHLAGEGSGIWGQFGVRGAKQDALSTSADGYESDQLIFTIGADFVATPDIRVGILASYADIENQDLRGNTLPTETTTAESIKLGVYSGISLGDRGFLNAEAAYLTGQAETARTGFFGAVGSEFDFNGFIARATLGYDILPDENVSLTPSVGVNFSRINFDDAQEAGGFGFLVERGDAVFAELQGGIEFGAKLSDKVNGFISGTVIRDLEDSTRSFRLSSAQLPTFSAVLPTREQNRFELNAGGSINLSDTFAIDLGYLGDFNSGYQAHSARAAVRIGF